VSISGSHKFNLADCPFLRLGSKRRKKAFETVSQIWDLKSHLTERLWWTRSSFRFLSTTISNESFIKAYTLFNKKKICRENCQKCPSRRLWSVWQSLPTDLYYCDSEISYFFLAKFTQPKKCVIIVDSTPLVHVPYCRNRPLHTQNYVFHTRLDHSVIKMFKIWDKWN